MGIDRHFIAATAARVGEAIDLAAFDGSQWQEASRRLAEAFPGSWAFLHSIDTSNQSLSFFVEHGIDPRFLAPYEEYYVSVNPWLDFWKYARPGRVFVASESAPASQLAGTEFYEDYFRLFKTDGAVGTKLEVGPKDVFLLQMHYPLSVEATYNISVAEVLRRIRGNLHRAVGIARQLRDAAGAGQAAAALVHRCGDIAFVVDGSLRIRDANQRATEAFRHGRPVSCVLNRVVLSNVEADKWLSEVVACLSRGRETNQTAKVFACRGGAFRVSVAAIPASAGFGGFVFSPDRLLLVLIRDLRRPSIPLEMALLSSAYGLTFAETRLARLMADGCSLNEAADKLEISRGTARQRLKTIFEKTDTHRQSELATLLARLN